MFTGETLSQGDIFYTDWFPRQADYAIFWAELIDMDGDEPQVTIKIFHKNEDATSSMDGTDTGKSIALSVAGRVSVDMGASVATPLRQLVRFKVEVSGGISGDDWVFLRMLTPVWFNKADA